MNIEEYLQRFQNRTENPTLEAMYWIMNKVGNPHKKCKFIHIAGTNGKGSCVEILNNILIKQGYKVGKYISPHLIKLNERICINNIEIKDNEMEKIILQLMPLTEEYNNTHKVKVKYFEITTCMAFIYYAQNQCDFVVLETGMGGSWDCTNIVEPIISVITSIGYDHMAILGNTIEQIAEEKAGIIKQNSNTVFLRQDNVIDIIKNKCEKEKNKLYIVEKDNIKNYSYNEQYQQFTYKNYKEIRVNLKGKIQIYNASICLEVIDILRKKGFIIEEKNIRNGLETVIHKARFEQLMQNPIVIYDGAHNEPAIINFETNIEQYYKQKRRIYIVSILKTKDYKAVLNIICQDKNSIIYLTDGNGEEKYVSKEELYEICEKYNKKEIFKMNLEQAIDTGIAEYENDVICIIGSFYIYSNVTKIMEKYNDRN